MLHPTIRHLSLLLKTRRLSCQGRTTHEFTCSVHILPIYDQRLPCTLYGSCNQYCSARYMKKLKEIATDKLDPAVDNNDDISNIPKSYLRTILKVRRTIIKARASPTLRRLLETQCEAVGVPYFSLILDSPTRWNSTADMFLVFLKQRLPIQGLYATTA